MTKQELKETLLKNHKDFTSFFNEIDAKRFEKKEDDKWSPGQNLEHIYLSVKPLAALKIAPKFFIKINYGKAKNGSRTYDETVSFYKSFLEKGGKATKGYIPKFVSFEKKEELIKKLNLKLNHVVGALNKFTEKDLDQLQLPHPIMGKLTMREMLYFTAYHVSHHLNTVKS